MVKFIEYDGKKVPYSVGYYALKRFKMDTGEDYENTKKDDLEALEVIMWYAFEAGAKMEKTEVPFNRDEMDLVLNDCMVEVMEGIADFFQTPQKKKTTKRPTGGGPSSTPSKGKK